MPGSENFPGERMTLREYGIREAFTSHTAEAVSSQPIHSPAMSAEQKEAKAWLGPRDIRFTLTVRSGPVVTGAAVHTLHPNI